MKLIISPYNIKSASAKALVKELSRFALLKKQVTPVKNKDNVLVMWGNSKPLFNVMEGVKVLNKPEAIAVASSKLSAFQAMKEAGVSIPKFTTDIEMAKKWINKDRIVLCRKLLRSSSGKGIVVAKVIEDLVTAPLYVKYIRKEHEYRVHVFNGKVIDFAEKKRRKGFKEAVNYNKYVRSYTNGWVYTRAGVVVPDAVKDESIKACKALGLDFGAVDVVLDQDNEPVILEVNTSPGLEGTTLERYKEAFKGLINEANR